MSLMWLIVLKDGIRKRYCSHLNLQSAITKGRTQEYFQVNSCVRFVHHRLTRTAVEAVAVEE